MAINLSGFLGGLGEGFGAYQKDRRLEEATKFERESELERQRLARLADKRGQEAIDRQARAEDRLTQQSEYSQGLGIFNQIQEIARADADDDITTGRFLRTPGLDDASRQQEVNARLQRYNQRQGLIKTLSGQGKVTQTFGDVSGLLRPTQFGTPDFKMPKPMIAPEQLRTMTDAELAKIYKAPAGQKADAVAQARKRLEYYADESYLNANVPQLGTSMGFGAARQPARALESPDAFFQQNPEFKIGVGGEKVLPTGAKQVVSYVNGKPMVEYQPALTANYVSPEADTLRNSKLRADVDILTRSADAKVNQEFLKAEGLRWKNLLSEKAYNAFDALTRAKINKLGQFGSSAGLALRKMSIMLAHQDRMAALGLKRQEFELDKVKQFNDAKKQFEDSLKSLEQQRRELKLKGGTATDFAQGGTRAAALDGLKEIDAQIAALKQQGAGIMRKDVNAANQFLGGQFAPASTLDPTQMLADEQTRQQQALLAAQMGMARPQVQQAPQYIPAPQSPSIVFNPTIVTGGQPGQVGQPGVGAPGAGGAGAPGTGGALGGGGIVGGGGVVPPGLIGGIGGGPTPPGAGDKPTPGPAGKPQKFETVLAGLRGQFPALPTAALEAAAVQMSQNPLAAASQKQLLKIQNDARVKENKKVEKALDGFELLGGFSPDVEYALNGKKYTGPKYVLSSGDAVPYDAKEMSRRRKAGIPQQWLTKVNTKPKELTPRERREQQSRQLGK
jgi:hypothetical protein